MKESPNVARASPNAETRSSRVCTVSDIYAKTSVNVELKIPERLSRTTKMVMAFGCNVFLAAAESIKTGHMLAAPAESSSGS